MIELKHSSLLKSFKTKRGQETYLSLVQGFKQMKGGIVYLLSQYSERFEFEASLVYTVS